jgi:hypothetical protein
LLAAGIGIAVRMHGVCVGMHRACVGMLGALRHVRGNASGHGGGRVGVLLNGGRSLCGSSGGAVVRLGCLTAEALKCLAEGAAPIVLADEQMS